MIAAIVFICSAIYFLRRRELATLSLCFGAIFSSGALTMQVRGNRAPASTFGNAEIVVTAHVTAEGELEREGPDSFRQRIDIETETLTGIHPRSEHRWESASISTRRNSPCRSCAMASGFGSPLR